MKTSIAKFLINYRYPLIILSIIIVSITSIGMQQLRFNGDYKIFFSKDNPQLVAFEEIERSYTKTESVIYVIHAKDGDIFSQRTLDDIKRLTDESWQMDFSIRVDSITNYQHTYADGDELIVEDFVDSPSTLSQKQLAQLKQLALDNPILRNNMISNAGHVSMVVVTLDMPPPGDELNKATHNVIKTARATRDRYEAANPNLDIYLFGITAINGSFVEMSIDNGTFLIPLMIAVIFSILLILIRSISGTLLTIFVIFACIVFSAGITGFIGYELNQVNISMPIIVLSLGVCDCVHLLNNYYQNLHQGKDKLAAMEKSLTINTYPLFLTTLTTAIGFLGLNFSDSPTFGELGNMCAIGVWAAFILSITMFPGLMALLPAGKPPAETINIERLLMSVCDFVIRQRKLVFYCGSSIALLIISMALRNDLNDSTFSYFSPSVPIRVTANFVDSNITGTDEVYYSINSGKPNGISDPKFLHQLEDFSNWLRSQPEVTHVMTYTDIIKQLNRDLNQGDPAYYGLPETQELAAQYLLLYEMSLPYGLNTDNLINNDKSAVRLGLRLKSMKAKDIIAFDERAAQWLKTNHPALATPGSSVSIMFAHIGQRNIHSMFYGSIVALALVSATLLVSLRSVRYGLISILPNSIPAAIAMGLWGVFSGEVNMAVAVIFTMTLGIIVDDTVHFLTKYIYAKEKGMSSEDAIRYAFTIVGKALIITTLVLSSGFFILAQSDFRVNGDMGLMIAVTILIALIFDLLVLPAFLLLFDNKRHAKAEPNVDQGTISNETEVTKG